MPPAGLAGLVPLVINITLTVIVIQRHTDDKIRIKRDYIMIINITLNLVLVIKFD